MVLLVLRPEPQAGDMVAALAARGVEALAEPMLTIEPCHDPVGRVRAADPEAEAIILTSRQTVAILRAAGDLGPLTARPAIAVGAGTAHDARAAGFADVRSADGNADDLVDLVARAGFQRLVHAGGRDKAGDVAGRLALLGVTVAEAEIYRAEPRQHLAPTVSDAFAEGRITGLVVASRRSSQAFVDLIDAMGWTNRLAPLGVAALSEAAVTPFADRIAEVAVATEPTGPALVEASVALAARLGETANRAPPAEDSSTMASDDHRKSADTKRNRPKAPVIDLEATEVGKPPEPPRPPQEPPVPEPPAPEPPEPEKPVIEPPGPDIPPVEPPDEAPPLGDPPGPDAPVIEPPPDAVPPRTDRPSLLRTAGPLVIAALLGGGVAAAILLVALPRPDDRPQAAVDPATLETRLGEVADRLAAGQTATETLAGRLAALEGRETPAVDLGPVGSRLDDVTARLDDLATRLDAAEKTAAARPEVDPATISALDGRLSGLDGRLAGLVSSVDALKAESADTARRLTAVDERLAKAPKGGEIAALSLAVTSLSGKIDAGLPFAADLQVVAAAAPDLPGLDDLKPLADTGVPTRDRLLATLPVDAMLARRPAEVGADWMDGLMQSAKSLVAYRETGETTADPASGAVEGIRAALQRGDAAAARQAADALPAWARPPATSWLADLDARVRADAAVKALSARLVDRLSVPAAD